MTLPVVETSDDASFFSVVVFSAAEEIEKFVDVDSEAETAVHNLVSQRTFLVVVVRFNLFLQDHTHLRLFLKISAQLETFVDLIVL
jgi:hypothetical protein